MCRRYFHDCKRQYQLTLILIYTLVIIDRDMATFLTIQQLTGEEVKKWQLLERLVGKKYVEPSYHQLDDVQRSPLRGRWIDFNSPTTTQFDRRVHWPHVDQVHLLLDTSSHSWQPYLFTLNYLFFPNTVCYCWGEEKKKVEHALAFFQPNLINLKRCLVVHQHWQVRNIFTSPKWWLKESNMQGALY